MAINLNLFKFKEISLFRERKKQRYLLFILVIIILLVLLFTAYNFLTKSSVPTNLEAKKTPEIKVNFDFLKNQSLKDLSPFEKVPEFQEQVGRENPFIPY